MTRVRGTVVKFGIFGIVMTLLTAFLFLIFGQYQSGSTNGYSAVFANVSRLKTGDSVRVAGVRVGTVDDVTLQTDKTVVVKFDAKRDVVLTTGTTAVVRYLNLVGDRYLELVDGPGSTRILPAGSQLPVERTQPALNLDLLLGGLKPVIQGLNPDDVNALTSSLLQVLQGQGDTLESLFTRTSSFTNALADHSAVIQQSIDNLRTVLRTLSDEDRNLNASIDKLDDLVTGLAQDREPIGEAIDALSAGTASLADLLTAARPPLAGTVSELNRLAPLLDKDKEKVETAIQKSPANYRKLVRLGSYGSWLNVYLCGITLRVSDLQLRTAVFPWIKNQGGRCGEQQ
jgi:phospholipid/cholesterol/gamma-HCH transport system substrate-binding protein